MTVGKFLYRHSNLNYQVTTYDLFRSAVRYAKIRRYVNNDNYFSLITFHR